MLDVRLITPGETEAFTSAHLAGFHHAPQPADIEYRQPFVDVERSFAVFDGSDIVGTADSFASEVTVPGGATVGAAAVSGVTVLATHRRQGLLRRMMAAQLGSLTEPVAVLIAAEAPIYGRFGYGPATEHVHLRVETLRGAFIDPTAPGRVRRCSLDELVDVGPAVFERYRMAQPGQIRLPAGWWRWNYSQPPPGGTDDDAVPGQRFHVIARDADGTVDGWATYAIKDDWDFRLPRNTVTIIRMVTTSDEAYRAMWHHLMSIDWVTRVEAYRRPVVEALPSMLTNRRAAVQVGRADWVWARLLDVPGALAARRYEIAGQLVIEVTDDFGGFAAGRFALEGGPDGASCAVSSASPDLTVGVADLSAAYLGGTPLWTAAVSGRVGEHREGAVAAFDRLFLTSAAPYCMSDF